MNNRERINIVVTGHVDHGKSTVIGKLLVDTGSLPEGKLEAVKRQCRLNSRPFEYAFLLDALKDEQAQGITIDTARVFFKTNKRDYIIIDAPGHIEFLKNMVSGASRAEAALIVIDAFEGIRENSKRHGYMLSMLGIKQVAVVVNKMDLVDFNRQIFENIIKEFSDFLKSISISVECYIPVCARNGENIVSTGSSMMWYKGTSVLETLEGFIKEKSDLEKPFRMPVQAVYKFTENGDSRRIIAGTVESGRAKCGDEIIFFPSGKRNRIKSFEGFNTGEISEISAGMAVGFTLAEQIYVKRGEVASVSSDIYPKIGKNIIVNIFWLGNIPFIKGKDYYLKIGTSKVRARLADIYRIINSAELKPIENVDYVSRYDTAECSLKLELPIAFDLYDDLIPTSRFVIVDDYEISGGGIIKSFSNDELTWVRDKVFLRNYKWEKSKITFNERREKYNQKSVLLIITGEPDSGKKTVAKKLETLLFNSGKIVYFLGIGNIKHGIDADIDKGYENREEHLRRTAEVANIILDAGLILILTAQNLSNTDLGIFKSVIHPENIIVIWTGKNIPEDTEYDITIPGLENTSMSLEYIMNFLEKKEII